jgi:hypothetical protein
MTDGPGPAPRVGRDVRGALVCVTGTWSWGTGAGSKADCCCCCWGCWGYLLMLGFTTNCCCGCCSCCIGCCCCCWLGASVLLNCFKVCWLIVDADVAVVTEETVWLVADDVTTFVVETESTWSGDWPPPPPPPSMLIASEMAAFSCFSKIQS